MANCPNCGRELPEGTKFCGYCGATLENAQPAAPYTPPQGYTPPQPQYNAPAYGYQPAPVAGGRTSPMMIVGMILSITALVLCVVSTILLANVASLSYRYLSSYVGSVYWSFALSCIALVLSIVGVTLSAKGKHRSDRARGIGITGLVIGIISIVYSSVLIAIFIIAFAIAGRL